MTNKEHKQCYTPGPWRSVETGDDGYYTHQIKITGGHIASIAGWSDQDAVCPTTEANARVIEHAPDLAAAVNDLLAWAEGMGGWDAPCWERARAVLRHATLADDPSRPEPMVTATTLLDAEGVDQGWNADTKLSLVLDFLDAELQHDPVLAGRLRERLHEAAAA